MLLGLLGVWYRNFFGARDARRAAVQPVPRRLPGLPAAARHGDATASRSTSTASRVDYDTGPIVWGEPRHQRPARLLPAAAPGHRLVPCDFIGFAEPDHDVGEPPRSAVANLFAQTEALAFGKTREEVEAEGVPGAPGRRTARSPATGRRKTILAERLTPRTLGQLIALYEHKVFVAGHDLGINSFDQWGVELGKVLAKRIARELDRSRRRRPRPGHDASTNALIRRYRAASVRDD